jgi:predicted RNase H-like nuclease (RuvC/YqgF family)
MSVDFSNAYQEILLENLMGIIKQNFMLQTQLKITENTSKENTELLEKYKALQTLFESVQGQIKDVEIYKSKAEQNNSAHEEKGRIQSALNDSMKKISVLQKEVENKDDEIQKLKETNTAEIDELKSYIAKLEDNVAVSKLKKLNPTKIFDAPKSNSTINTDIKKTDDGSAF